MATCVGEEGLDIGEVDLIVCFDAHASPIRLVQRMGRTGRKRDGRIVILVTEGKEEQVHRTLGYVVRSLKLSILTTVACEERDEVVCKNENALLSKSSSQTLRHFVNKSILLRY